MKKIDLYQCEITKRNTNVRNVKKATPNLCGLSMKIICRKTATENIQYISWSGWQMEKQ